MTLPDQPAQLRQLARQGDHTAIAQLINQAIAHKRITATVIIKDTGLDIGLSAATIPDETIAVTLIQRELVRLKLDTIETVTISGKSLGADEPAWVRTFELIAMQPSAISSSCSPNHPSGRSPRKQSFTLTFSDVRRFAARFNPFKLGFTGLLAIYGMVGAPNYTVDGFLDGSDRVMMFVHGVNLIFHEAGHTILAPFGEFLHILGGSLMQVLVPAVIAGYFVVTRQIYASTIALWWMAQNLWDVSIYIKDAQERSLPLLGGEGVLHDWHFLLLDMHLLAQDQLVGGITFLLGVLVYLIAIAGGIYYAQVEL